MNRLRASIALIAATAAQAAVAHPPEPEGLRAGWYLAPMYTSVSFDRSRDSASAGGQALAVGYRWTWLALEARGEQVESLQFTDRFFVPGQDPGDPPQERRETGEASLSAGHLSVLAEPLRLLGLERLSFLERIYATLGAGLVKFQNSGRRRPDAKSYPYEAGLGYVYPFKLWGVGLAVRAQAIYRFDPDPTEPTSEPDPQQAYEDVLYHAGFQIPLSPSSQPRVEPVTVVPPAFTDADGDGVVDPLDQCPETPVNSLVNNVGCVPQPQPQGEP